MDAEQRVYPFNVVDYDGRMADLHTAYEKGFNKTDLA